MISKCLAIGVGTVLPDPASQDDGSQFPFLDGAIVAATTIGQWARNSGFAQTDVIVLTDDQGGKVVEGDLTSAIEKLVPAGAKVDHLIVFFAGHGLTGDNDDITYWMLSDSLEKGYKIFVEELRRRLYGYGVGYLSIFSDACRAIADKADTRALESRSGVSKRASTAPTPDIARYNACQDATSAFMVREPGSAATGKCLFSGVLAEALWGRIPEALDGGRIDSASLGRGLKKAVKARAKIYGLTLDPGGNPFFDEVYYYDAQSPPMPPEPDLSSWPPAGNAIAPTALGSGAFAAAAAPMVDWASPAPSFGLQAEDSAADAAFVLPSEDMGDHPPREWAGPMKIDFSAVEFETAAPRAESIAGPAPVVAAAVAEPDSAAKARRVRRRRRAAKVRSALRYASGDQRIAIGGKVAGIWSGKPVSWNAGGGARALLEPSGHNLVMIEFADGLFAPLACYAGLGCQVVRDDSGVIAVGYGEGDFQSKTVTEALARLQTKTLTALEADALAIRLREAKHVNPVLGAIAAYCYDLTGDMDAIRRMAGFYRSNGQPAPYDIALLGMLDSADGEASIPAVPKDRRRDPSQVPSWLIQPMGPGKVPVAGRCPWLRQGWDYVVSSDPGEEWLTAGLTGFAPQLRPSAFTTFEAPAGQALVALWGLQRYG